jgi:CRISPR/Cas system-associated exonuclease Cas4 (RecB family)
MSNINFKDICKLVNAATEKSIADFFVADLNYAIIQQQKQNVHPISQSYKPSSLHCIRNMYYQVTGQPVDDETPLTPEGIGIGESGTDRHERIQQAVLYMKTAGIDCEYVDVESYIKEYNIPFLEVIEKKGYETKLFNSKYNFRFMCDGIIKYKGNYYILEIKTETSFKWNKRTGVDPSHYNQAIAYALNFKINDVIFLYECRDTCTKKGYLYSVSDAQINELKTLINNCDKYIAMNKVPPIPENICGSKYCRYCDYRNQCKEE